MCQESQCAGSAFLQLAASGAAAFMSVQEIRMCAGRCWSQANLRAGLAFLCVHKHSESQKAGVCPRGMWLTCAACWTVVLVPQA